MRRLRRSRTARADRRTPAAVAASVDIILYYAFPHNSYHSCAATILAKLYSNSLLAIFNSRLKIVGGRDWRSSDPAGNLEVSDFRPKRRRSHGLGPLVFTNATRTTATTTTGESYPGVVQSWREADGDKEDVRLQLFFLRSYCELTSRCSSL